MNATEYYLSAYLVPPGPDAFISLRHDHCVALWVRRSDSIELVRYWELERWSGRKHHAVPMFSEAGLRQLLDDLLAEEGLSLADIQEVWGTPGLAGYHPFPVPMDRTTGSFHCLAHLWTGFLNDTNVFRTETIVGLAMDGGPDFDLEIGSPENFYVGGVSRRGDIMLRPIASPAVLFKAAHKLLGLEPGSLMAVAGASTAAADVDADEVEAIIPMLTGPAQWPPALALVRRLIDRATATTVSVATDTSPLTAAEEIASAVATTIQTISQQIAVQNVEMLLRESEVDPTTAYLAMTGGFALNCPTNSFLLEHFGFRGLIAPPCANDGGQALGIGLLALHQRGDLEQRDFRFRGPYYGRDRLDVEEALKSWRPWIEDVSDLDLDTFVDDVVNDLVAWVDGAAEIGPRALGHRSLLGDPRSTRTKDRLNVLKRRQWWRPVAPMVLEDHVADWFVEGRSSPYMLEVFKVRAERRDAIPAVLHLDGTARIQTLADDADPRLPALIRAFLGRTGVPILCNTSLNDKREPIVDSAGQALNFCVRRGVSVAYLAGRRVLLRASSAKPPQGPEPRDRMRFERQPAAEAAAWAYWDGQAVTPDVLFAIGRSPQLRQMLRLRGVNHVVAAVARDPSPAGAYPSGAATGRRSFQFDGSSFVDETE